MVTQQNHHNILELHDNITMNHIRMSCYYDITWIAIMRSFDESCLADACIPTLILKDKIK